MKSKKQVVLNEEQLLEVERLAGLFFDINAIATVLEIDSVLFKGMAEDMDSDVYRSYFKGKLIAESEIRRSVIQLAKQGSSPAQVLALKMLNDMNKIENI